MHTLYSRNKLLYCMSTVDEQPAAYDGGLSVVHHTTLEGALANLGGCHLLLYMYAKVGAYNMYVVGLASYLPSEFQTHFNS